MANGGRREGSGRKKGPATIEREKVKDFIAQQIALHAHEIVGVLMEKSLTGDVPAIKELFDRGFGKAMQGVELSGKDGEQLFKGVTPALLELSKEYDKKLKDVL